MKKLVFVLAALTLLSSLPAAAQEGSSAVPKLGAVNLSRVMLESRQGQASRERLNEYYRNKMTELQTERQALEREQTDLQNQRSVLSESAFTQRRNDLEQRMLAFRQRSEQADRELQRMQLEETNSFLQVVAPIIAEIGEEQSYTLIFEIGSNQAAILYADTVLDITDEVVRRLNALPETSEGGGEQQ